MGIASVHMKPHEQIYNPLFPDTACSYDNVRLSYGFPLNADMNDDRQVNTADLSLFVLNEWLACSAFDDAVNCPNPTVPNDGADLWDSDFTHNYYVNMEDFSILIDEWENPCGDANDIDCPYFTWP